MAGLQPWGCKVQVHDTAGSKLDGRSKIGRWVGFDPKTKEGHCVYWPKKRSISVERSVRFNFEDEITIRVPLLKGEIGDNEVDTQNLPDVRGVETIPAIEPPKETKGRGQRI